VSDIDITAVMNKLCPTWEEAISLFSPSQQNNVKEAVSDYYLNGKIATLPVYENAAFILSKAYIDGKLSIKNIGEGKLHWNWKGGITPENQKIRASTEYKYWLKAVLIRDKYTCQCCGRIGGKLNAHHIKSFAKYPELRLDENNGITYCRQCHIDWHKKHGRGK
jgi:hypothetical protein